MKALVAVTCIAVLAAVGYYFWNEWTIARAADQRSAEITAARAALFEQAKADPHDVDKVVQHCAFVRDGRNSTLYGDYAKMASARCTAAGF